MLHAPYSTTNTHTHTLLLGSGYSECKFTNNCKSRREENWKKEYSWWQAIRAAKKLKNRMEFQLEGVQALQAISHIQ